MEIDVEEVMSYNGLLASFNGFGPLPYLLLGCFRFRVQRLGFGV